MAKITIDIPTLVDKVRAASAALPDREGDCHYFHDGEPACIIGHAFAEMGITESDIIVLEGGDDCAANTTKIRDLTIANEPVFVNVDGSALWWLEHVQRNQDDGLTWRDAVDYADTLVGVG